MSIQFTKIPATNLYGYEAMSAARHVEVVRAYASDWRIFGSIHGRTIKACAEIKDSYSSYQSARKDAIRFLNYEFTPETW